MSDRELLEMAARAYWGDEIDDVCSIRWCEVDNCIAYIHGDNQNHNGHDQEFNWNPLTDDGDALRLAVKLRIDVYTLPINGEAVTVTAKHRMRSDLLRQPNPTSSTEMLVRDPYAATRRAITRAAAEIGRKS